MEKEDIEDYIKKLTDLENQLTNDEQSPNKSEEDFVQER